MTNRETFSSRWGLILAGLGLAVGTGNLWRFPRIAAENGGAAFLIPWIIFLFLWSLPLMIAEFGIGRGTRRGVVGSFAKLIGSRYAWMGGFIAVTTIMVLFYYTVVTGWALKYFFVAISGGIPAGSPEAYWATYSHSVWQPIFFHLISVGIGAFIIQRGVVHGIERANRILIPILFLLLIVAVIRSVTLPGADRGLAFLFNPDLSALKSHKTWLEALTQSAWSTGAGWGMLLTYATYMRRNDDVVLNASTIGLGDNSASLLAGMAIVPTAFALLSNEEAQAAMASGNEGLTFIWIPQLFALVPFGHVFLPLFFLALFCAALSTLIAMIEFATRILMDGGVKRRRAVRLVASVVAVMGIPSAVSMTVFVNQDWVWGLALMISGLFIAIAVIRFGQDRFLNEFVNVEGNDLNLGRFYGWLIRYVVPAEFIAIFSWWVYAAVTAEGAKPWWNPTDPVGLGTCLLQWGVALSLLIYFNKGIAERSLHEEKGQL